MIKQQMSLKFNKFCAFDGGKTKKKKLALELPESFFYRLILIMPMLKTMTDICLLLTFYLVSCKTKRSIFFIWSFSVMLALACL